MLEKERFGPQYDEEKKGKEKEETDDDNEVKEKSDDDDDEYHGFFNRRRRRPSGKKRMPTMLKIANGFREFGVDFMKIQEDMLLGFRGVLNRSG